MGEEKEEYKRFTVSLPKKLYDDFEKFRKELNMSRSDIVRKAMLAYMISEENIPEKTGEVVGCITMIKTHEHFDPTHQHFHDHPPEKADKEIDRTHDQKLGHLHDHDFDYPHKHDFTSQPIYANVAQTDIILNNDIQHHFSDIIKSTMHIHIEFEKCLELIAVSGPYERVLSLKKCLQRLRSVLSIGFFAVDKK